MRVDAKVVMLGKESVGKTSLVERYVHHRFLVGPYQNVSMRTHPDTSLVFVETKELALKNIVLVFRQGKISRYMLDL